MTTRAPLLISGTPTHPLLALPIEAVTETFGILGIKGSGKSTTAKVLVEQLTKAGQQCVVIDPLGVWWGLKAFADGKTVGLPFTILGGDHADVPITGDVGATIADLAIEDTAPLIIDLSLMRKAEQRRFMLGFVEQLYHRNRAPLHLVIDECDLYVAQRMVRGEERLLGAMEDLVRRGRVKGIGVTLISQRPASVHKDVLSQVSVLVAHRLVGPQDRAALDSWVQAHGDKEHRDQMMAELAGMPAGTAWFWSPSWLDVFAKVKVNLPATFDSMATPKAGARAAAPSVLATVDIAKLRERLGAIVAQAEATDPKVLRRRILELERLLTQARDGAPSMVVEVEKVVEVEVIPASLEGEVWKVLMQFRSQVEPIASAMVEEVMRRVKPARHVAQTTAPAVARTAPANARIAALRRVKPARHVAQTTAIARNPAPEVKLKAGARRLLETVARHHPMRMSQSQVGTLAGFKVTGGTFGTYKSILRREGLIDIDGEGMWTATEAGRIEAGVAGAEPMSVDEVLDRWRSVLKLGARTMLDVLIDNYPKPLSRSELAGLVDMAESGGTFGTYLSTLRRNGLIDVDGSMITASDTLFVVAS